MPQTNLLVGTTNGFCAVFLSASSALRLDCTVSAKHVKKKMFFGKGGEPWVFRFPFFGKKIPCGIKAAEESDTKCKINLETLTARAIVNTSPVTAATNKQTKNEKMKYQLIMIGSLTGNMISFGTFPSLDEAMKHAKELSCELYGSPLIREVICAY